jgi:type IV pilus assembly protein PilN
VILINLLPHREERRKRRKAAYFTGLALGAVAGLLAAGLWYGILEQMKSAQMQRNAFIGAEIKKLEAQIADIANLRAEIDALKARQKAVEDLQTDRNIPVHLLNELVKQTPEGVYLNAIKMTGKVVAVTGVAQSNERVSEFLRNTLYSSAWLEKPELVEIVAGGAAAGGRGRTYNFSMRVSIKPPQAAPAAVAASAAVAGKSAAVAAKAP